MTRTSMYEERASTPDGVLGLAAANLAGRVVRLLLQAKERSKITSRDLAERLGITEGRVSQVLNGDGNVHVATLARFLRAMGMRLELSVVPADAPRPTSERRARRRGTQDRAVPRYDVYEQRFISSHGVVSVPMWVLTDEALGSVPEGQPMLTERSVAKVPATHTQVRTRSYTRLRYDVITEDRVKHTAELVD